LNKLLPAPPAVFLGLFARITQLRLILITFAGQLAIFGGVPQWHPKSKEKQRSAKGRI